MASPDLNLTLETFELDLQSTDEISASSLSPALQNLLLSAGIYSKANNVKSSEKEDDSAKDAQTLSQVLLAVNQFTTRVGVIDGFISFEECSDKSESFRATDARYYENFVQSLSPIFQHSEDLLVGMSNEEFVHKYHDSLIWTKNLDLFDNVFAHLAESKDSYDLFALLVLCAGMERSLGNLYLLKGTQCPAMLKDLLITPELCDILGVVPLQVLQVVIGPPISMNIRNVAWHGFLAEGEIPRRYIYFLLLLTASIGNLLNVKKVNPSTIPCRDYVHLRGVDRIAAHFSGLLDEDFSAAEKLIYASWVVDSSNRSLFETAFQLLKKKKYGSCSILLFPLLEHALRRMFVKVNNCPSRLITAETTTLFTTFEEILECNLPSGQKNGIIQVLGEPCLSLLHDLLVYPSGPRARDRLSHGEADYVQVSAGLPRILIVLLAWLSGGGNQNHQEIRQKVTECMNSYSSLFHPVAMLQNKVLDLAYQSHDLHAEVTLTPALEPWNKKFGLEAFTNGNPSLSGIMNALSTFVGKICVRMPKDSQLLWESMRDSLSVPFSNDGDRVKEVLLAIKIETLYRWKQQEPTAQKARQSIPQSTQQHDSKRPASTQSLSGGAVAESEIVGLTLRLTEEAQTSLVQTMEALRLRQRQLVDKQLRSRQRDNLKRLLLFAPIAGLMASYVVCLSSWIISHLNGYAELNQGQCRALQKQLKSTLQTMENMRTYTASDKNKWSEAGDLLLSELNGTCERVVKNNLFLK